jgi:DNA polymerase III subunit delta
VGADLGQLTDAIERLVLYAAGREVSAEDVEAVVTSTRTRSVFELSDAIGEGDAARALAALGSLLKAREPGLRILAMIARQVRLLLQARGLLDEKANKYRMAEALKLPPFVVDKLESQARRFDIASLVDMHRAVYRTDQLLKSSKVEDDRWLESLVLELARRRAPAKGARARG